MKWKEILNFFSNKTKSLNLLARNTKDRRTKAMYRAKAEAYNRVYRTIRDNFKENELVTIDRIESLLISKHMKDKMKYYLKNPTRLPKIEIPKEKEKALTKKGKEKLIQDLTSFMGIGISTAKELIKKGLTNVNQIRNQKYKNMLSDQTKLFLSIKPIKRIPHGKIKELESSVTKLLKGTEMIIVGSYRRKTRFSRDVDVMVISDDHNILYTLIKKLQQKLGKDNVYPYTIGSDKISVLIADPSSGKTKSSKRKSSKSKNKSSKRKQNKIKTNTSNKKTFYKWDFFRTPTKDKWAMLLYSTGSQAHNILMRRKAQRNGMKLNQMGLFDRETGELLSKNANSEKWFFDKLDMKYKEPQLRI